MEGLRIPCLARPNYLNSNLDISNVKEIDPEALLLAWLINRPSEVKAFDQALHHLSADDFRYGDTAIIFDSTMGILDSMGAFSADATASLPNNAVYTQLLERCAQGNNTSMVNAISMLVVAANHLVTSPAVITSWIDMILQRGCRDRVRVIARYLLDVSARPLGYNSMEGVAQAMVSLNEIAKRSVFAGSDNSKELMESCQQCLDDMRKRALTNEPQRGLLTGFSELDQLLGGLQAGNLYLLASFTSVGKSAFALNVMENIVSSHSINKPILFFSLEMANEEIGFRTLSTLMRANTRDIEYCQLSQEQIQLGHERLNALDYSYSNGDGNQNIGRLLVDDNGSLSPNLLATKVRQVADEYGGVSMIVIDYLQLMINDSLSFGVTQDLDLTDICRQLKLVAKEYSCPVLALSQLNRQVENFQDQSAMFSLLRDFGAIEQYADAIMILSKSPNHKKEQGETEGRILNLVKNSNGRIGSIDLNFRGAWLMFTESASERQGSDQLSPVDQSVAKGK